MDLSKGQKQELTFAIERRYSANRKFCKTPDAERALESATNFAYTVLDVHSLPAIDLQLMTSDTAEVVFGRPEDGRWAVAKFYSHSTGRLSLYESVRFYGIGTYPIDHPRDLVAAKILKKWVQPGVFAAVDKGECGDG